MYANEAKVSKDVSKDSPIIDRPIRALVWFAYRDVECFVARQWKRGLPTAGDVIQVV